MIGGLGQNCEKKLKPTILGTKNHARSLPWGKKFNEQSLLRRRTIDSLFLEPVSKLFLRVGGTAK